MIQTSIYFANSQLQILQGELKKNGLTVKDFITVPLNGSGLINGVITNEDLLYDALERAADEYHVAFKNVRLIINTSLAINKSLPVPKLKPAELEEVCRHEFEDSANFEKLVMDYKGTAGQEGGTNMFAVAMERDVIASFKHLFDRAGIKLRSIDTALSAIVDYVDHTPDYAGQTFALFGMDGSNLLYALFENGRYIFSSQARIVAERESEAFTMEVMGKLSSLLQFHKSQKSPYDFNRAFFSGVTDKEIQSINAYSDGMEVATSLLPTTDNIHQNPKSDEEFYLDMGFIPAAALFETKDAIDLLKAFTKGGKAKSGINLKNKALIPPLAIVAVMVIAFIGFTVANLLLQRRINIANDYVNDATNAANYAKAQQVQNTLTSVQSQLAAYTANDSAIASYPGVNSDKMTQIISSGDGVTVKTLSYDASTGSMEVTASASNAYQGAVYLNNLINSGLFSSVEYQGYTYSGGSTGTTTSTTVSTTATTTAAATYDFSYTAVLKGGS